jgi:hypothetical protein
MIEKFIEYNPRTDTLRLITECETVINRYKESGLRLTLRQLYYQLVSINVLKNEERSYKNLSSVVSRARLGGMLDWDSIEDRIRKPNSPPEFTNLADLVEVALVSYRLPRWKGQDYYAELWTEKDAIANILLPIARKYHITLMVNRGYSSQSALYEAAIRLKKANEEGRSPIIFYLGDFDPSGEDMVRDIKERLTTFEVEDLGVEKIGLTIEQVKQFKLPPNPAKMTDPRAKAFVEKYGASSWEVDALPPDILILLCESFIKSFLDQKKMDAIIRQENKDKKRIRRFLDE